jgi:hypothetical protein
MTNYLYEASSLKQRHVRFGSKAAVQGSLRELPEYLG